VRNPHVRFGLIGQSDVALTRRDICNSLLKKKTAHVEFPKTSWPAPERALRGG
jgi:hypothetical protein